MWPRSSVSLIERETGGAQKEETEAVHCVRKKKGVTFNERGRGEAKKNMNLSRQKVNQPSLSVS